MTLLCFSLHFSDTRTLIQYYVKAFIHIPKDRRGYTMDISIRHSEEEEEITEHYDDSYLPLELIEEAYSWIDASMSTMSDEEMLRVAPHNQVLHAAHPGEEERGFPHAVYRVYGNQSVGSEIVVHHPPDHTMVREERVDK